MTCQIDLFRGDDDEDEKDEEEEADECDIDETDEKQGGVAEVKTVRQLNFKPRIFEKETRGSVMKQKNLHPLQRTMGNIAGLTKLNSEEPVMPHMNFFLEKKRKHEEEFSHNTISTLNSDKVSGGHQPASAKVKKRRTANFQFNDEDLDVDDDFGMPKQGDD